jgi:hypothetical protein
MRRLGSCLPAALFILQVYHPASEDAINEPAPTTEAKPRPHPHPAEAPPPAEEPVGATPPPEGRPQPEKQSRPEHHHNPPQHHHEGPQASPGIADARPVASIGETISPPIAALPKQSGGGSSPVVPLLIAVSVLAVISIGVARYRLKR